MHLCFSIKVGETEVDFQRIFALKSCLLYNSHQHFTSSFLYKSVMRSFTVITICVSIPAYPTFEKYFLSQTNIEAKHIIIIFLSQVSPDEAASKLCSLEGGSTGMLSYQMCYHHNNDTVYSACRFIETRIIESAAYWNQILPIPLYLLSTQKASVN